MAAPACGGGDHNAGRIHTARITGTEPEEIRAVVRGALIECRQEGVEFVCRNGSGKTLGSKKNTRATPNGAQARVLRMPVAAPSRRYQACVADTVGQRHRQAGQCTLTACSS